MVLTQAPLLWQQSPFNAVASLNRGSRLWLKVLPQRSGGVRWLDLTGYTASGTLITGATFTPFGPPGSWGSVRFDGTSGSVAINTLNDPSTSHTIALWVYRQNTYYVFDNEITRLTIDFGLNATDQNLSFQDTSWHSLGVVPANSWQHVVLTLNAATTTSIGYLNGKFLGTSGYTALALTASITSHAAVGSHYTNDVPFFQGWVDDFRVWNRVLSASEVRQLYMATRLGYPNELNWFRLPLVAEAGDAATVGPPPYQPWQLRGPILAM